MHLDTGMKRQLCIGTACLGSRLEISYRFHCSITQSRVRRRSGHIPIFMLRGDVVPSLLYAIRLNWLYIATSTLHPFRLRPCGVLYSRSHLLALDLNNVLRAGGGTYLKMNPSLIGVDSALLRHIYTSAAISAFCFIAAVA